MAEGPLLSQILANSVSVTLKAADIVREIMASGELGIVQKNDINDLQTKADRAINDAILKTLVTNFPGLAVIGEEGEVTREVPEDRIVREFDPEALKMEIPEKFKNAKLEDFTIWVDPLDGTKEYTEGFLDHVTILVGICIGDDAIAGVINQPFFNYQNKELPMGRNLYGIVGSGVVGIERKLPDPTKRIVCTTKSHGTGLINDAANACNPTEIIRVGGAGHKVMLLIEGVAHAYVFPSPGCKRWDTAAPEAILHAMGGKLTDIHGNFYKYNKNVYKVNEEGTLATCVLESHKEYLDLIPQELKAQVKDYFKNKAKK